MSEELKGKVFNLKKEMKKLTKGNQRLKSDLEVMTECAEEFEKAFEVAQSALQEIQELLYGGDHTNIAKTALSKVNEIMGDF